MNKKINVDKKPASQDDPVVDTLISRDVVEQLGIDKFTVVFSRADVLDMMSRLNLNLNWKRKIAMHDMLNDIIVARAAKASMTFEVPIKEMFLSGTGIFSAGFKIDDTGEEE